LGQTTWTGTSANGGASKTNAAGFAQAAGVCYNGTTLYVRDCENNRVLGYHGWPTAMGQAADFVIGQPDFVSNQGNNGGVSKSSLNLQANGGNGIECSHGKLIVTDTNNYRVLIWNTAPTSGGVPADIVLGQSAGNLNGQLGAGGVSAGGLMLPQGAVLLNNGSGGLALAVSDSQANRVVQWDTLPTTDGAPFSRVYGQPDKSTTTANTGGLSMSALSKPIALAADDTGHLWVGDFNNGRALQFAVSNPTAVGIFGQRNGTSEEFLPGSFSTTRFAWNQWTVNGVFGIDPVSGLFSPFGGRFWNQAPRDGNAPLSAVQGEPDASTNNQPLPISATTTSLFSGVATVGSRIYYSDAHRILSKIGDFAGSNEAADVVLGNQDFNGNTVASTALNYAINPTYLATDGTGLFAADGARIIGWSTAPTSSNVPITLALGQPTTLVDTANNGGVSASTLGAGPNSLTISGGRLIVTDSTNHRVLIWNEIPATTGQAANIVLGQSGFTTNTPGSATTQMNTPSSAAVLDGKLIVSDTGNGRLLIFNRIPTTSGAAADLIWDPRTVRFSMPTWYNEQGLAPRDLGAYQGRLYIGQTGRVLVVPDLFVH
jgi:hypothetical protein